MLSRQGFNVIRSSGASEALDLISEWPQLGVDLVLVDLGWPPIDGPDLVHRVHRLRPELPVLFIGDHADPREPATPCIARPYTGHSLAMKIRQVLGQPYPPL